MDHQIYGGKLFFYHLPRVNETKKVKNSCCTLASAKEDRKIKVK